MVNKSVIVPVILCLLPGFIHAKIVTEIQINKVGIAYSDSKNINEIKACKQFKPSQIQLIDYFNTAEESIENKWMHEYYSACISTGHIKFNDGMTGRWTIQSSGLGYVTTADKKTIYFFRKNNGWNDPNACTYGSGDEPEC